MMMCVFMYLSSPEQNGSIWCHDSSLDHQGIGEHEDYSRKTQLSWFTRIYKIVIVLYHCNNKSLFMDKKSGIVSTINMWHCFWNCSKFSFYCPMRVFFFLPDLIYLAISNHSSPYNSTATLLNWESSPLLYTHS